MEATPTAVEQEDQLLLTFRILRCGIVAAALILFVSLAIEWARAGSQLGSISAYFYSPVRSIFVGCLMAIGVCLIAIQARTVVEETFLNLAGLFAFVVALVPIRPDLCQFEVPASPQTFDPSVGFPDWMTGALERAATGTCRLPAADDATDGLPSWVVAGIRNNVLSVLAVGVVALVALVALRKISPTSRHRRAASAAGWALVAYIVLLAAGIGLYVTFDGLKSTSHYVAAITMFVMFGVVVVINGWRRPDTPRRFRAQYRVIAVLMILVVPLGAVSLYWLEAAEIVLFAWFWLAQTVQIWDPRSAGARSIVPAS